MKVSKITVSQEPLFCSLLGFAHLKIHISSDVNVVISYHESLSFFPAVAVQRLLGNTKAGICVHLIKNSFVVLNQQSGLKQTNSLKVGQGSCVSFLFYVTTVPAIHKSTSHHDMISSHRVVFKTFADLLSSGNYYFF